MSDTEKTVESRLKELGVPDDVIEKIKADLGAEKAEDLAGLTEADLTGVGMKPLQARKLIKELTPVEPTTGMMAGAMALIDTVLRPALSEDSWLSALKTGGVLKVEQSTIEAAIRAALAHRVNFFTIPDILVVKMEEFADSNVEQVDPSYYDIRDQLISRSYGDLFAAIKGFKGTYVTEGRKKQLYQRIDDHLWPAIISFNNQLKDWYDAWLNTGMNPKAMMNAFFATKGGAIMPPAMIQPPDTGVLRDSADALADAINKVFAGTGVQIAAAIAFDASKIKETLTNPRLPAMIGAGNRDQMLRQLNVAIPNTYQRLETNLVTYVGAVLDIKNQPAGEAELNYYSALYMLGSSITWDLLEKSSPTPKRPSGIGGRKTSEL